jgi:hypothetical protein
MSSKHRLVLILVFALTFCSVLGWIAFHPTRAGGLWSNPLIVGLTVVLCITPIYPLYRQLGKHAPASRLAIALLIGALTLGLVYIIADRVLQLNGAWVSAVSDASTFLLVASCLAFIWNGFMKRDR